MKSVDLIFTYKNGERDLYKVNVKNKEVEDSLLEIANNTALLMREGKKGVTKLIHNNHIEDSFVLIDMSQVLSLDFVGDLSFMVEKQ